MKILSTGGSAILWLLFFPNAPYILTEFQQLAHPDSYVPVWYDVTLLIWFGWNGLLPGILSLYFMQESVRDERRQNGGSLKRQIVRQVSG